MKTSNLPYLIPLGIGLLTALAGFIVVNFTDISEADNWMFFGLWMSELAGFFMLLMKGTFIKTRYFKILKGVMAFVLIGVLFTVMKWEYNRLIFVAGIVGIITTYFFSFINKPIKKRLDYLKLSWVVLGFTTGILEYLQITGEEFRIITSVLLWLALIDYMKTERAKRKLFK